MLFALKSYSQVYRIDRYYSFSVNRSALGNFSDNKLYPNQWYNIVVTRSNVTHIGEVYINGVLKNSVPWGQEVNNLSTLILGYSDYGGPRDYYNGYFDEFRISNNVRNATEIASNYNLNQPYDIDRNTVALWHFNETNGTSVVNSVNSVNGTLNNGVSFANGKFGNALKFDGQNDWANLNFDIPDNIITTEYWIKFDTIMSTRQTIIYPFGSNITEHWLIPHADTIRQATNITFSNLSNNQVTFNWTDGNSSSRVVFIKQDSTGTAEPINNKTYTANTSFGSGSQIGTTGWFCVFNGTTHTSGITVTNLFPNITYRVMVCEYNGTSGFEVYNTNTAINNPYNKGKSTCGISTDGLVAWYPFNGNANDESGHGNNGTVNGASLTTDRFGNLNHAYSFNGINNFIYIPPSKSLDIVSDITICCWIKLNQINNGMAMIIWRGDTQVAHDPYMLHNYSGNVTFYRDISDGSNGIGAIAPSSSLNTNDFIFIVGRYSSANNLMEIFINNVLVNTIATSSTVNYNTSNMWNMIGSVDRGNWQFFNGKIDDIRIYNRALNDCEIKTLFHEGTQQLTLISPNGSERWNVGDIHPIIWTANGIDNVKIEYSINNGTTWTTIINDTPAGSGSYAWTVPDTPSESCLVKITSTTDGTVFYLSDLNFSIVSKQNPCVGIPTDGLVAWYPFNGNANDASGNNNNGTVNGATLTMDRFGNANKAYSFNGNADISIANATTLNIQQPNGQISISVWAKKTTNASVGHILGKRTLCGNFQYQLAFNSSPINIGWGGPNSFVNNTLTVFPLNEWIHYVGTFDGTTWKLYKNGVFAESIVAALTSAVADNLIFGGSGTCQKFVGSIDDIRIYNRALNECEIQNLFQEGNLQLTLTSPNGGVSWNVGDIHSIIWTDNGVANIKLEYSINNGATWTTIINDTPASPGSYAWTVPDSPSEACLVKITSTADGTVFDQSHTAFEIYNGKVVIQVPNAFTPNGDGYNDYFEIHSTGLKEMTVTIYDSWGVKTYEIKEVNGKWDGKTLSGSKAPDGVYFYYLTATGTDNKIYERQGSVNLFRDVINVYPNPVHLDLKVKLNPTFIGMMDIEIFSSQGERVYSQAFDLKGEFAIPVSHLADGLYTLRVTGAQGSFSENFLKN